MIVSTKTSDEVAAWMKAHIDSGQILYQQRAVAEIKERFGDEFIATNRGGNEVVGKTVLAIFFRLTGDKVVWSRRGRCWRRRERYDLPGRAQL